MAATTHRPCGRDEDMSTLSQFTTQPHPKALFSTGDAPDITRTRGSPTPSLIDLKDLENPRSCAPLHVDAKPADAVGARCPVRPKLHPSCYQLDYDMQSLWGRPRGWTSSCFPAASLRPHVAACLQPTLCEATLTLPFPDKWRSPSV